MGLFGPETQLYRLFHSALKSSRTLMEVELEKDLCFVGLLQVNSKSLRDFILKKNNSQYFFLFLFFFSSVEVE